MNDREINQFQSILKYISCFGLSIQVLADEVNISKATLYNWKNGLRPKREKYNYVMAHLWEKHSDVMNKVFQLLESEYIGE